MKRFDTSPTVEPLAGVKWTTQYGYYRAKIAGWLDLSFSWESGTKGCARNGFRVFVGGAMLKARGSDPEDAARIAVAGAKSLLARASKELPTEPPTHVRPIVAADAHVCIDCLNGNHEVSGNPTCECPCHGNKEPKL